MQTIAAQGVGSDDLHVMGSGYGTDNHEQATASTIRVIFGLRHVKCCASEACFPYVVYFLIEQAEALSPE
jgi:hypothetical protein